MNEDKIYLSGEDKIIALMIDGDNVSSDYIDSIEQEVSIIGRMTHKRLYYTYSTGIPNGWANKINSHSLSPKHVMPYNNGKGKTVKNVADSLLIIDAMDIKSKINTMFIVASDSDYTALVKRLKEDGIYVIGAGDKNTPVAFIRACDEFKYLERLKEQYSHDTETDSSKAADKDSDSRDSKSKETFEPESGKLVPKKEIENYIIRVFEKENKTVLDAGFILTAVRRQYPDFDYKDYGARRSYEFFDPAVFTVIPAEGKHTNINVMYPAQKKKK